MRCLVSILVLVAACGDNRPRVACASDLQCSDATECATYACVDYQCRMTPVAAGTAIAAQTAGDCERAVCDGDGNVAAMADDSDVPVDGNACTTDVCAAGAPSHGNLAAGTLCGVASICDGQGSCVGACGDGIAEGDEPCDGADLRAQSCAGLGFTAGTLACRASCTLDSTGCTTCGNGVVEPGEACDGAQLGGASCGSLWFQHGALACTASCTVDSTGCSTCGDGARTGGEACDGGDLGGASCASLGHAPGALTCNASCDGFDATGCDGGFVAASTGFSGTLCNNGFSYNTGASYLAACTTDQGVWKLPLTGGAAGTWFNNDGVTAGSQVTNLHGHAIYALTDMPFVLFYTDPDVTTGVNAWRTNSFAGSSAASPATWPTTSQGQTALTSGGFPVQVYAARGGSSANSAWGGWHQALGAVVQHGNNLNTATLNQVAPGATGTVTSLGVPCCAPGANAMPSTDVHVAVFGQQPDGTPGTGGIYWACDIAGTAGGSFVEQDAGIAEADRSLVFALAPDNSTFSVANMRLCPKTGLQVAGFAATWYAALRGGGQVYKTIDAGVTWLRSNTGLPPGAEVFTVAVDCASGAAGTASCVDPSRLYAATSQGLYTSADAGARWTLAGLANIPVRTIALLPHAVGTMPPIYAGADDAVRIYMHP